MSRVRADMHMHTTASDGTWTGTELIEKLIEKEIKVFSVTDHDTIENLNNVKSMIGDKALQFIPGTEISAEYEGYSYHILCYAMDEKNQAFLDLINYNKQQFEDVDCACIRMLELSGQEVSVLDYKAYLNDASRGGWKALNYLIDKGICSNHKEFFTLFETDKQNDPLKMLALRSPKEVISIIKNAGGVPVLAHPGASFYNKDFKHVVNSMIGFGIEGIECYHPENTEEITQYCLEQCNKNNLLITGGSDCHGDFLKNRGLCKPEIYLDMLSLGVLLNCGLR